MGLTLAVYGWGVGRVWAEAVPPVDFQIERPGLDSGATGEWWKQEFFEGRSWLNDLRVPRDEVVGFALYTHSRGELKMTAQLYPLMPNESRTARLELKRDGEWREVAATEVVYPGWSAHFRLKHWDDRLDVPYRVRHGERALFEGLIRRNPIEKDEIVVASLSCNSSSDRGDRERFVRNLRIQNPDLLFFAGDQSYDHSQHTAAWLMWGRQFRDVIKDRPVVTIPDDHDVGQANIWGEGGKKPEDGSPSGGYALPVGYVNMVQRSQTWHLPDPYDSTPVDREISVYYTSLNVGGVDFSILEDRKFKSGPKGKIPHYEPKRPDHINDSNYDPKSIDLPGLVMLGERQLKFLREWGQDWTATEMKCVLSQTNFAGAVHLHGYLDNRLLADLDSNGWPQTGRNAALREIRRALACHLAGDQHLAVVTQHGIDGYRDGPYSSISPAIVNEIYGRWWWPENEQAGARPVPHSPLPWTGDYRDGFGNLITMLAYANPNSDTLYRRETNDVVPPEFPGDGYSVARFNKAAQTVTFECWSGDADVTQGESAQYPGWPISIHMRDNDGRQPIGHLPTLRFTAGTSPVVQVIAEATGEILYTQRVLADSFQPPVYAEGRYTVRIGRSRPDLKSYTGLTAISSNPNVLQVERF